MIGGKNWRCAAKPDIVEEKIFDKCNLPVDGWRGAIDFYARENSTRPAFRF
jgi:hypothetical protein